MPAEVGVGVALLRTTVVEDVEDATVEVLVLAWGITAPQIAPF